GPDEQPRQPRGGPRVEGGREGGKPVARRGQQVRGWHDRLPRMPRPDVVSPHVAERGWIYGTKPPPDRRRLAGLRGRSPWHPVVPEPRPATSPRPRHGPDPQL